MTAIEILNNKRDELEGLPIPSLSFTVDEINDLADTTNLCMLKLKFSFPTKFSFKHSAMQSFSEFVNGDKNIYRVLEICLLKNPSLRLAVCKVFPQYSACFE